MRSALLAAALVCAALAAAAAVDGARAGPDPVWKPPEGFLLERDGCHACAEVGTLTVAFDFDARGKFVGTRVVRAGERNAP